MSHSALDIENWKKINLQEIDSFSYNNNCQYVELEISAAKFYFFLKEKHGLPNVAYSQVARYFPDRMLSTLTGTEWCFVFQESSNFILVCGDDKINITVFSIEETPTKSDFALFCHRINIELKNFSLAPYNHIGYDIFINYSFYLNNLISEYKTIASKKIPPPPEQLPILHEDVGSKDPAVQYKYIENCKDYNQWLQLLLEKVTFSLQIQILLPIHFESLIDLAFRIKLKKSLFTKNKTYDSWEGKIDIFENFEPMSILKKLKEIKRNCSQVNIQKISKFISDMYKAKESGDDKKQERNKLIHGNALFFQNLNFKCYGDDNYIVGMPEKARSIRMISDSIQSSMEDKNLLETIEIYEKRCKDFIDIFDDDGHFKTLASGIAFGHNAISGGSISFDIKKYEDLFAPTEWSRT